MSEITQLPTPEQTKRENRALLCERLRVAADFIAETPDMDASSVSTRGTTTVTITDYSMDGPDDLARVSQAIGGRWEKRDADELFKLVREVRDGVTVELVAWRAQVCERVVTGTETVEVPDPDAPKVTVEREVVEWKCAPLLSREA